MTTSSAFAALRAQFSASAHAFARCVALGLLGFSALQPAQAQTTVAGNVPGEFAISPMGAATYRVPIAVPPGVGGMEPKLALSYSSHAGNGIAGVGWSIEGSSVITRCTQSMASDGVRGRINYNALDVFCLDGQRLMLVSGSYGVADSEYRTELDGFSRIRAVGVANSNAVNGPASFVVQTKAGLTLEYGSTADSQVEAQGKSVVRMWALSRMKDAKGNSVSFTYVENSATSEHQLSSITYGSNSVWFAYEARSDVMVGVEAGSLIHVFQRLKEIETRVGSNTVQRTKLSYSSGVSTGRSRMQSITQCAADNTCLAPLTFNQSDSADLGTFQVGSRVLNESTVESPMGNLYSAYPGKVNLTPKLADLNGDGVTDLLYAFTTPIGAVVYRMMGKGDGSFLPSSLITNVGRYDTTEGCTPELTDLNNDSKVDLLYICPRSNGMQVIRWLGNGDGSFPDSSDSRIVNVTGLGSFSGYIPQVADINGDGIPDLLLTRADASGVTAYKWIGKGDGFFQPEALAIKTSSAIDFTGFFPRLADLNGDGLVDLVYAYTGPAGAVAYSFLNNGTGSFNAPTQVVNTNAFGSTAGCTSMAADLNGDGTTDLLYACAQSGGAFAYRWMGNGDGSFQPVSVGVSSTGFGSFSGYVAHLADVNGDGVPDLIFTGADIGVPGVRATEWIGRGDGSFFDLRSALVSTELGSFADFTPLVIDLNGDGLSDLFYFAADYKGGFAYLWRGKGVIPDRLSSISNGAGTTHQLNYKFTSDRSVYSTDVVTTYPRVELQVPIAVVSSMSQNNGLGGFNTTTYRYGNLAFEHSTGPGVGRGTLGFGWTLSEELVSGVKLYTEYRQDFPYTGISHFAQTLVNGRIVKQTSSTYACIQTNLGTATTPCGSPNAGKVYFPYAASTLERSWDLNGAELPSITTASTYGGSANSAGKTVQLGDATLVQVDVKQGAVLKSRKVTTNTYATANVSGSNWILGRLARASVLSSSADSPASGNNLTRTSSFEYDASGLLTKETVEPNRPQDCLQTTTTYDVYGNRVGSSSAACAGATGNTVASAGAARSGSAVYAAQTVTLGGITYVTPAGVFATTSTNALGQSETSQYDPRSGQPTRLTGPNGLTTTWAYDGFGRKIQENRADGTRTTWQYKLCAPPGLPRDAACPASIGGATVDWYVIESPLTGSGAALAPPKLQFHDTLGRIARVQTQGFDGGGTGPVVVQDTVYNIKGQVTQKSIVYALAGGDPKWSTYSYDALGRTIQETVPEGSGTATTSISYNGLATSITNAQGQTQTKIKNAAGQLADVKDGQGFDILYTYDALGQLVQTSATGATTKLTYDQRGRKIKMEDPAMGVWDYAYNAFGELVWQSDSLGQVTTLNYDALGRLRKRIEPDLVSEWSYEKDFRGFSCSKGIGKLCETRTDNGYRRFYSYDGVGRLINTATALDDSNILASITLTFDPVTGRLATQNWPTGYQAKYSYTALGFLKQVDGSILGDTKLAKLEVLAMDAQGRVTQYRQGGQITTVKNFDAVSNKINSIQTTLAGKTAGNLLNHSYSYDKLGNLLSRQDFNTGLTESFAYDSLNRLALATTQGGGLASPQTVQVLYDSLGNIKYKSDVGYYSYDASHANRLNQVTLTQPVTWSAIGAVTTANTGTRALSYAFDDTRSGAKTLSSGTRTGNGNLWYTVSQDSASGRHTVRWETYTSFNQPLEIKYGNLTLPADPTNTTADRTLAFVYGPEHQRIKQTVTLTSAAPSSMEAGTTWYLNGDDSQSLTYEKEIKASGLTEHRHFLSAGGITFALYVKRTGTLGSKPASSLNYWHQDHLGSLAVISNEAGVLVERLAYDPWGKRRNVNGTADKLDALYSPNTDRGFTQHEHLDEMGIIHMNGRIYDPLIGRFMSADPHVQSPQNLQSYNRYAYVLNNPLAFTDPSGYFSLRKLFHSVIHAIVTPVVKAVFNVIHAIPGERFLDNLIMRTPLLNTLGQFTATVLTSATCGGCGGALWASYYSYQATGSMGSAYRAGAMTLAMTVINTIGNGIAGDVGKTFGTYGLEHFAAHAAVGCSTGMLGGGSCGSGALAGMAGLAGSPFGFVGAVVAGGTASVIGGGKFVNGAVTGAYGYLFNQCAHAPEKLNLNPFKYTALTYTIAYRLLTSPFSMVTDTTVDPDADRVIRYMSKDEYLATEDLARGGRSGITYATDDVYFEAAAAQQALSLPRTPELMVVLGVKTGVFSQPTLVRPAYGQPGGGTERTATGKIPVTILDVVPLK